MAPLTQTVTRQRQQTAKIYLDCSTKTTKSKKHEELKKARKIRRSDAVGKHMAKPYKRWIVNRKPTVVVLPQAPTSSSPCEDAADPFAETEDSNNQTFLASSSFSSSNPTSPQVNINTTASGFTEGREANPCSSGATTNKWSATISTSTESGGDGGSGASLQELTNTPGRIGIRPQPTSDQTRIVSEIVQHNLLLHGPSLPKICVATPEERQPRRRGPRVPTFRYNGPLSPTVGSEMRMAVLPEDSRSRFDDVPVPNSLSSTKEIVGVNDQPTTTEATSSISLSLKVFTAMLIAFEKTTVAERFEFDTFF